MLCPRCNPCTRSRSEPRVCPVPVPKTRLRSLNALAVIQLGPGWVVGCGNGVPTAGVLGCGQGDRRGCLCDRIGALPVQERGCSCNRWTMTGRSFTALNCDARHDSHKQASPDHLAAANTPGCRYSLPQPTTQPVRVINGQRTFTNGGQASLNASRGFGQERDKRAASILLLYPD